MRERFRKIVPAVLTIALALCLTGCQSDASKADEDHSPDPEPIEDVALEPEPPAEPTDAEKLIGTWVGIDGKNKFSFDGEWAIANAGLAYRYTVDENAKSITLQTQNNPRSYTMSDDGNSFTLRGTDQSVDLVKTSSTPKQMNMLNVGDTYSDEYVQIKIDSFDIVDSFDVANRIDRTYHASGNYADGFKYLLVQGIIVNKQSEPIDIHSYFRYFLVNGSTKLDATATNAGIS